MCANARGMEQGFRSIFKIVGTCGPCPPLAFFRSLHALDISSKISSVQDQLFQQTTQYHHGGLLSFWLCEAQIKTYDPWRCHLHPGRTGFPYHYRRELASQLIRPPFFLPIRVHSSQINVSQHPSPHSKAKPAYRIHLHHHRCTSS